jgi:hypothetical protein
VTSDEALANLQSAMQDYASARKGLDLHRGLAKHGIPNELAYAVAAEHSALHRLDRAQKAYAALQPAPTPKPAPKPVVASANPEPRTAPVTPPARGRLTHFQERLEEVKRSGVIEYRKRYGLSSPYSDTH